MLTETTLAQLIVSSYSQPNSMLYPQGIDCNKDQHVVHMLYDNILPEPSTSFSVILITRKELNNKIELREIFGPLCLSPGQYLGSRKILKVFIIHNNIDRIGWTL